MQATLLAVVILALATLSLETKAFDTQSGDEASLRHDRWRPDFFILEDPDAFCQDAAMTSPKVYRDYLSKKSLAFQGITVGDPITICARWFPMMPWVKIDGIVMGAFQRLDNNEDDQDDNESDEADQGDRDIKGYKK